MAVFGTPSTVRDGVGDIDGLILFDGDCRFCTTVVALLLRLLRNREIRVCSNRSIKGVNLSQHFGAPGDVFAFATRDFVYTQVDAYIEIFGLQPRTASLRMLLTACPRVISLSVYRWVATHRAFLSRFVPYRTIPADKLL